jgi:hypothetical protein
VTVVAEQPLAPIQQAIYQRLTGDGTLMGLITGVFDDVPEDRPYDYVVVGEVTTAPDNHHGGFGRSVVATLHVWTRSRGFASALAVEDRVVQLLDHQPLPIPGHDTVSVRFEFSQTLVDPEPPGDIRHIPIRFRISTEQED